MNLLTTRRVAEIMVNIGGSSYIQEYLTREPDASICDVLLARECRILTKREIVADLCRRGELKAKKSPGGRWMIVPRSVKRYILRHEVREQYEQCQFNLRLQKFIDAGGDEQFLRNYEVGYIEGSMITRIVEPFKGVTAERRTMPRDVQQYVDTQLAILEKI